MTHTPVDLDARRSSIAQDIDANRRRILREFRQELEKMQLNQERFADRLSETLAEFFPEELTSKKFGSSRSPLPMQHATWVQPINSTQSPTPPSGTRLPHAPISDPAVIHLSNVAPSSTRFQQLHSEISYPTAVVYCEANFGGLDGKTANGLVRHSEKYNILAVIDSEKAGEDSARCTRWQAKWHTHCQQSCGRRLLWR